MYRKPGYEPEPTYPSSYSLLMVIYVDSSIDEIKAGGYDDEYLDYLNDSVEISDDEYLIIVKLQKNMDDTDAYYYALKVKKGE